MEGAKYRLNLGFGFLLGSTHISSHPNPYLMPAEPTSQRVKTRGFFRGKPTGAGTLESQGKVGTIGHLHFGLANGLQHL